MSNSEGRNGYTFTKKASIARLEKLLALLAKPMTALELGEAMSADKRTINACIRELRSGDVLRVYIAGWRQNCPGSPSPIYAAGPGPDKRKPRALTDRQKYKRRIAKNPEAAIRSMQRKRLAGLRLERDPLTAALFGGA